MQAAPALSRNVLDSKRATPCGMAQLHFQEWITPDQPIVASTVPTSQVSPGWMMIRKVPEAGASISLADLSLSSRNSGWPSTAAAPSATSHSEMVPSLIEKPILGMRTSVDMLSLPLLHHDACRLGDARGIGHECGFERL